MFANMTVQEYITVGAGGISFLVLMYIIWYFTSRVNPLLSDIRTQSASHTEVIRNNSDAIKEVSRSNDNVAKALAMLQVAWDGSTKLLEKHDERAASMEMELMKISERTTTCVKK